MEIAVDISNELSELEFSFTNNIEIRNNIIQEIKNSIKNIRSKRIAANKDVAKYLMNKIWSEKKKQRKEYNESLKQIELTKAENY